MFGVCGNIWLAIGCTLRRANLVVDALLPMIARLDWRRPLRIPGALVTSDALGAGGFILLDSRFAGPYGRLPSGSAHSSGHALNDARSLPWRALMPGVCGLGRRPPARNGERSQRSETKQGLFIKLTEIKVE
jgi:hypothetical protein